MIEQNTNNIIDESQTEHILVCLSSSPSNQKIIQTAARMTKAYNGSFTALYVQTPKHDNMDRADKVRLTNNIALARSLGATVVTVYGDNVPYQIAEYARLSGITKIVIGRSVVTNKFPWFSSSLTDQLISISPQVDIHIIPDSINYNPFSLKEKIFSIDLIPEKNDILKTFLILILSTLVSFLVWKINLNDANIITVYILGVQLTSMLTKSYLCSAFASLVNVLAFDFFFTQPYLTFHVHEADYLFTFFIMLVASLLTGTLASQLKSNAKMSAQSAYRTRILFDTNLLLQKANDDKEILSITAGQIMKMLNRDVVAYPEYNGRIHESILFTTDNENNKKPLLFISEVSAAKWAFANKKNCGAGYEDFSDSKGLYMVVSTGDKVYGVIGIHMDNKPLEYIDHSIVSSIIGECALAIENIRNAKAREEATAQIQHEQLRSNLLRAISHDLRTPLTSISGNADNLRMNYEKMAGDDIKQAFADIYDDSQWLIKVVENLLSVTRIEDEKMNLNYSNELIDDIIIEALSHINNSKQSHNISTKLSDDILITRVDASLIVQVIINLVENAIKYTPEGSDITVQAYQKNGMIYVDVADNGQGIPDSEKEKVFEIFYTGDKIIADSRRSFGLGLSLCKSIINAHNGTIYVTDNKPSGCVFTFTLPSSEVKIHG